MTPVASKSSTECLVQPVLHLCLKPPPPPSLSSSSAEKSIFELPQGLSRRGSFHLGYFCFFATLSLSCGPSLNLALLEKSVVPITGSTVTPPHSSLSPPGFSQVLLTILDIACLWLPLVHLLNFRLHEIRDHACRSLPTPGTVTVTW